MKRAVIKKTICLVATVALCSSPLMDSKAVSFTGEASVAGIEISLSDYCNARNVVRDSEVVNFLSARTIGDELADTTIGNEDQPSEEGNKEVEEQQTEDKETDTKETKEEEKPVSEYENVGISIAPTYVNVRKKPDTDSKILGKLYKGCAAKILETKGDWVKIKSGSVAGYINKDYLAIGFDAEELVSKYGTKIATVNTTTLKVRDKKSTEAKVLTMIPLGESYVVLKEYDEWVKVSIDGGYDNGSDEDTTSNDENDDGVVGFVSKEYVNITVEFDHAISIEEEEAKERAEEAARQAEAEQAAKLLQQQQQQQQKQNNSSSNNSSSSSNASSSNSNHSNSTSNSNSSKSSSNSSVPTPSGSGTGSNIASYAQKFIGNRYVYGGTSLTNGTDCSGFVQSVYKSFGYNLPRTSGSQAGSGTKVDIGSLQPGDLVFYSGGSGRVNHVAIYIGGGRVVHASNPRSGIKTSSVNYRTPCTARRIVK